MSEFSIAHFNCPSVFRWGHSYLRFPLSLLHHKENILSDVTGHWVNNVSLDCSVKYQYCICLTVYSSTKKQQMGVDYRSEFRMWQLKCYRLYKRKCFSSCTEVGNPKYFSSKSFETNVVTTITSNNNCIQKYLSSLRLSFLSFET